MLADLILEDLALNVNDVFLSSLVEENNLGII